MITTATGRLEVDAIVVKHFGIAETSDSVTMIKTGAGL
jgi:hypothetical protein